MALRLEDDRTQWLKAPGSPDGRPAQPQLDGSVPGTALAEGRWRDRLQGDEPGSLPRSEGHLPAEKSCRVSGCRAPPGGAEPMLNFFLHPLTSHTSSSPCPRTARGRSGWVSKAI